MSSINKDHKQKCQPAYSSDAETTTRVSAGAFSDGVQALITCTPQLADLSNVYSNIDTLHLSLYADLSGSNILEEIENARAVAREFEQDCVPFTYFSKQWNVHRSGRRFFTYHISMADTHVYFNNRSVHGNFPTCLIEIGSMSSHLPGAFEVYDQVLQYLKSCDIAVKKHHVTRVDLSTDFVNVDFKELDLHNMEKWITRAVSSSVHYTGRNISGMSIGKGNLMCRIYDKRIELKVKRATAKEDFFNRQWGLNSRDQRTPVVRVEFQYRREALTEFKTDDLERIATLDDLKKSLNGLWGYSSKLWSKHCENEVDRSNNHQSRDAVTSPFWKLVQLVTFDNENPNMWRKREKNQYSNVEALIDQGVGCLCNAMAATLESLDDYKQIALMASNRVWREIQFRLNYYEEEFFQKAQIVFNRNNLNPVGLPG